MARRVMRFLNAITLPRPGIAGGRRMTGVCNGTEYRHRRVFPSPAPNWDKCVWYPVLCIWAAGRFTARTEALFTHHLLERATATGVTNEVNLMPGNDARLIANLKAQNLLYTVAGTRREKHRTENYRFNERSALRLNSTVMLDSGGNGAPGNRHRLANRDRKRLLHRPASGEQC